MRTLSILLLCGLAWGQDVRYIVHCDAAPNDDGIFYTMPRPKDVKDYCDFWRDFPRSIHIYDDATAFSHPPVWVDPHKIVWADDLGILSEPQVVPAIKKTIIEHVHFDGERFSCYYGKFNVYYDKDSEEFVRWCDDAWVWACEDGIRIPLISQDGTKHYCLKLED